MQGLPFGAWATKTQLPLLADHNRFPLRAGDRGRPDLEAAAA
jgi:hypothetical protein